MRTNVNGNGLPLLAMAMNHLCLVSVVISVVMQKVSSVIDICAFLCFCEILYLGGKCLHVYCQIMHVGSLVIFVSFVP